MDAVELFLSNWFMRNLHRPDLTLAEQQLVRAAMGTNPRRWEAESAPGRMIELIESNPDLLARIGDRLLSVLVGMRGAGPAVRVLLERGAKLELDASEYNVLHEAAWAGATDTLREVFEAGVFDATPVSVRKPHTGWPDNLSLMYWVAWGGYPDLARLLIAHGVGVHHELQIKGNGERGTTSLQEAVAPGPWKDDADFRSNAGKREVARILVEDGAEYDICSAAGLDDAARVKSILQDDPESATAEQPYAMTPLHWAARAGSVDCANLLLDAGANVNALTKVHRAPLHLAAEANQEVVLRLLIRRGANADIQDRKGRTPLHRAAYEGCVATAEALLELGANARIENKNGKNALEVARKEAKFLRALA